MGWGGACVNVHVKLLGKWTRLYVCRYVRVDMGGVGWGGACVNVHVKLLGKWTRLYVCRYVRVDMGGVSCCEKKKPSEDVRWKCDQFLWFQHHLLVKLYECLSLVIVSCSMQVKVRCKVVWQVVPNSSIHNMLKSRSVARSSGRLCQLHQYITCGITKNVFSPRRNTCFFISCTRIRGFLVFELTSKQYRSN